jgi:molecular chaperone DnaJ
MDLYRLLGLDRTATSDDVERAYRRLARRHHPGINPGDRVAAEIFRQIQQAYTVLGDLERRSAYDRGIGRATTTEVEASVSFTGFDFSSPAEGSLAATFSELFADVFQEAARERATPTQGADIHVSLSLAFKDAVQGGEFPISVARQDRCPACGGDGRIGLAAGDCPACGGHGTRRWARGHMVFDKTCEACEGNGRLAPQPCRPCAGVGTQARADVVRLAVPPGIEAGTRVAVPGRGHVGARGGPVGDLYVTFDVSPHRVLRRVGRDLQVTLPVAIHEAALGARVMVPTLDGPEPLRIPAGTRSGQQLRLRGRGVPAAPGAPEDAAGDLVAEVSIVLPSVRDERSRALLRQFGELNQDDVRAGLFEE